MRASTCLLVSFFLAAAILPLTKIQAVESSGWTSIDKKSGHVIVIGENANSVTRFAAQELKGYLLRITGAEIPIRKDSDLRELPEKALLVGAGRYTVELGVELMDPAPEAFLVKSVGGRIVMLGDDVPKEKGDAIVPFSYFYSRKGSVFAVYEFLERFGGVRWLFPGRTGEVVPSLEAVKVDGVDLKDHPDVDARWLWSMGSCLKDISPFSVPMRNEAEFNLWLMRLRQGMTLQLGFRGGFSHSWGEYIEGNKYFDSHPEYYALCKGERQKVWLDKDGRPKNQQAQVCTSNPEVVAIFARRIQEMYKPEEQCIVSISPNDGGGFCECASCKALDHPELYGPDDGYHGVVLSDRIFTFVNAVAREVKRTHPKLTIGIMAYTYFNPPPKTIDRFESNVRVKFVEQPESYYHKPIYREKMRANLEEWSSRVPGLVISEHYDDQLRIPVSYFLPTIKENTRLLTSHRVCGVSMEMHHYVPCRHMDYYVLSRLFWNGRQDVEALLGDYFERGYGKAAAPMRRYFDFMNGAFRKRQTDVRCAANAAAVPELWLQEDLETSSRLLNEATAVADSDDVRNRIEFVRCGNTFMSLFRNLAVSSHEMTMAGFPIPMRRGLDGWGLDVQEAMSAEAEKAMIFKAYGSYRALLSFLKQYAGVPGLDPRLLWAYAVADGYPQAIVTYEGMAEGRCQTVLLDDAEGGRLRAWSRRDKDVVIGEGAGRSGEKSIVVKVEGATSKTFGERIVQVEEGVSYIVSLYYRPLKVSVVDSKATGSGGGSIEGPTMILRFQNGKGVLAASDGPLCRPIFASNRFASGLDKWYRLSRSFQVPENVGANKIRFIINVPPGEWSIDDISIVKAGRFDLATGELK